MLSKLAVLAAGLSGVSAIRTKSINAARIVPRAGEALFEEGLSPKQKRRFRLQDKEEVDSDKADTYENGATVSKIEVPVREVTYA